MTGSARIDYALPWALLGAGFAALPATVGILYADTRLWQAVTIFLSLLVIGVVVVVTQVYWSWQLGKYTAAAAMSLTLGVAIGGIAALSEPCLGNYQGFTDPCSVADTSAWVVSTVLGWLFINAVVFILAWLARTFWKLALRLRRH